MPEQITVHPAARLTSFFAFGDVARSHATARMRSCGVGQRLATLAPVFPVLR